MKTHILFLTAIIFLFSSLIALGILTQGSQALAAQPVTFTCPGENFYPAPGIDAACSAAIQDSGLDEIWKYQFACGKVALIGGPAAVADTGCGRLTGVCSVKSRTSEVGISGSGETQHRVTYRCGREEDDLDPFTVSGQFGKFYCCASRKGPPRPPVPFSTTTGDLGGSGGSDPSGSGDLTVD